MAIDTVNLQILADELLTAAADERSHRAARTLPHPVDGDDVRAMAAHEHTVIPPRRHSLHAIGDTVALLSVARGGESG